MVTITLNNTDIAEEKQTDYIMSIVRSFKMERKRSQTNFINLEPASSPSYFKIIVSFFNQNELTVKLLDIPGT